MISPSVNLFPQMRSSVCMHNAAFCHYWKPAMIVPRKSRPLIGSWYTSSKRGACSLT